MRLLDRVRDVALRRRLAKETIKRYQAWIIHFLRYCRTPDGRWRTPAELNAGEVEAFLTHLARDRHASACAPASQSWPRR